MFVRSPMFTKFVSGRITSGSSPLSLRYFFTDGTSLGLYFAEAFATSSIWAGVVPQHPPIIFANPLETKSSIIPDVVVGDSSYSPISFGRPAFG